MNKLLKNQLENTQTLEHIVMDVKRRFNRAVIDLVEIMQEGVGYVAFNDMSGFPELKVLNQQYEILGVMVRIDDDTKRLYLYVNDQDVETMTECKITNTYDGWFNKYFGVDFNDLFDCLTELAKQNE